jgi:hypothetical protein
MATVVSNEHNEEDVRPKERGTVFFEMGEVEWKAMEMDLNGEMSGNYNSAGGPDQFPDTILGHVDIGAHFRNKLWSHYTKAGEFNFLRLKYAPNFTVPRHYHNIQQVVWITKGEARQGNRSFVVGQGWTTRAGQAYSVTAGPEGVEYIEVRSKPIEDLLTVWVEDNPTKWQG